MKIKRIKYIDSAICHEETDEICEPLIIEAVGFIVEETEKYITLSLEVLENGRYRNQLSIPKVSILK